MKIVCDTLFKHNADVYHEGDIRTVSDEDGAYFVANAWAHVLGDEAAQAALNFTSTDLNVHNSVIGMEDTNG